MLFISNCSIRNKEILVEGMNLLNDVDSDRFTFSATKYNFPIQRALRKDKFNLAYPINENDIKKEVKTKNHFMMLDNFIREVENPG